MKRMLVVLMAFATMLPVAAQARAAGPAVEAPLVRCGAVEYPATLTGCGTDPLGRGQVEVKRNGKLELEVSGAVPNAAYDIVLHSLDGASQLAVAVLTTDATGAGEVELKPAFELNQAGVVAFSLNRNGSVQFVAGFDDEEELKADLIPCGAVNLPAVQTGCGSDTLRKGLVKIERRGEVKVDVVAGPPLTTYDAVLRPLGGGPDVALGTLTTDAAGHGRLRLDDFVPRGTVGAGNVVLRRESLDQFVSGFQITHKHAPQVAKLNSGLVRCSEVNTLAPLAGCGIDQLKKGHVLIIETGDVKVQLQGGVPLMEYEVVFVSFDATEEVSIGTLTTNPAGNGHLHARDAFPVDTRATGNVVIRRAGLDQYVTGFIVVR
ncbi:MAG TPA: hypothetical protein VGD07_17345 [Methylomirabilota bacterium]